jgi:diguanylate cyclase (GGDEF)-like protein
VVRARLQDVLDSGRPATLAVQGNGNGLWLEVRMVRLNKPEEGLLVVALDISDQKEREALLSFDALHDPLTGLHNRTALLEHTRMALARLRRRPSLMAVLYVDLDQFKEVNDRFGHRAGDRVLTLAAQQLRTAIRPADLLARVGGDEFVVVCEAIEPAEAHGVARRLIASLEKPIRVEQTMVSLNASVGVVFAARHTTDAADLINQADRAMYRAKLQGTGTIHVDTAPSVSRDVPSDGTSREATRRALDRLARMEGDLAQEWAIAITALDDEATVHWRAAARHIGEAISELNRHVTEPDTEAAMPSPID